jgi:hypothetical protein
VAPEVRQVRIRRRLRFDFRKEHRPADKNVRVKQTAMSPEIGLGEDRKKAAKAALFQAIQRQNQTHKPPG